MDYKNAGVDIEAGYKSVELMKKYVQGTMRPEVMGGLGGFSGAFSAATFKDMEDPVLLSGTDGCGTKLKLAFIMDKHDTVGIDCVAMCVNDIACAGGEPLFFLDYIACGKNYPEKIAEIVKGDEGCGAQRRGQRPEPQLPRPCRSGRSCGCRRIFGLCGGFQNAGFQTGRSLHFDAGSDGVEGCFRLAVEFGAGGTCFEMFQHFAANLCGGIVIEQQFDSVFKIGAFHGG